MHPIYFLQRAWEKWEFVSNIFLGDFMMSFLKIVVLGALFASLVHADEPEGEKSSVAEEEVVAKVDFLQENQTLSPQFPFDVSKELQPVCLRRSWQYLEVSFVPPFIPGSVGYGYRTLGKWHGWEASLHLSYFSTIFVMDFGWFQYRGVSAEFAYLPHFFVGNTAVYLGLVGGAGVGQGIFGAGWQAFPVVYLKPGMQFPLSKKHDTAMFIDFKVGFPMLACLNSGVAF